MNHHWAGEGGRGIIFFTGSDLRVRDRQTNNNRNMHVMDGTPGEAARWKGKRQWQTRDVYGSMSPRREPK